jgi:hypothetical protein
LTAKLRITHALPIAFEVVRFHAQKISSFHRRSGKRAKLFYQSLDLPGIEFFLQTAVPALSLAVIGGEQFSGEHPQVFAGVKQIAVSMASRSSRPVLRRSAKMTLRN